MTQPLQRRLVFRDRDLDPAEELGEDVVERGGYDRDHDLEHDEPARVRY